MPRMLTKAHHVGRGFTIVELLVVLSVLGVLMSLVFVTLSDFYDSSTRTLITTSQNGDLQTTLRTIEKNVATADRFLTSNAVADPTTGTSWAYGGSGSNNRVLILSTYATTGMSDARELVYSGAACDQVVKNNLVYFVDEGTLYRRTIKNPITSLCNSATIWQKQSCAIAVSLSVCQAKDAVLLRNVTAFSIDYYAAANDAGAYGYQYSGSGQSTIESTATKAIKVSITTNQNASGKNSTITNALRMTRQN